MEQNMPRRLMRFYRNSGQKAPETPQNDYSTVQNTSESEPFSPNGREILREIPSMNYEDVKPDENNSKEIEKFEQKNLEQKLALEQVEKFKKENNRLPTKEEADQIAENLYSQLKNVDTSTMYGTDIKKKGVAPQQERKHGRHERTEQKATAPQSKIPGEETTLVQQSNVTDVKSLFGETSPAKSKNKGEDEFDLGLGDDVGESEEAASEEEESDNIEDISLEEKETCPNCKKETEKVIYCPKCGTAFCPSCAKKQGTETFCPKCGTKVKI